MKRSTLLAASLLLAAPAFAADTPPAAPAAAPAPDPGLVAGYAIGLNLGSSLKRDGVTVDQNALLQGLKDAMTGAAPKYTPEQMNAAVTTLGQQAQANRQAAVAKAAEENRAKGAAYLKANGARPGVVTLPDGLQYEIVTAGTGPLPKAEDTVECQYRGTTIDGQEFDSSANHGGPAQFPVNGVIKGWTEALQKMPVGSKWKLYIPSDLAYGDAGREGAIPPAATLVFEVELLRIVPKS
jgi:FKBP-type peptidyl-prolyl cis-trans isomerase FklB